MIKYNLKKTKTTQAETLAHCLTVITILVGDSSCNSATGAVSEAEKKWKEAEKYLKNFIKELFKQQ